MFPNMWVRDMVKKRLRTEFKKKGHHRNNVGQFFERKKKHGLCSVFGRAGSFFALQKERSPFGKPFFHHLRFLFQTMHNAIRGPL